MHTAPDTSTDVLRRAGRALAVAVAVWLPTVAAPAIAAPPEAWPDTDNGSALTALLLLVGAPLALFVAIMLLSYLPSMTKRGSRDAAQVFGEQSEWFGGPRKGVEGAGDRASVTTGEAGSAGDEPKDSGKGGASATW